MCQDTLDAVEVLKGYIPCHNRLTHHQKDYWCVQDTGAKGDILSFDLAFWHEDNPITAEQARHIYWQLCDDNDRLVKAYPITHFLEDVAQRYPPISAYRDEDVDGCPWNCDWSVTPGSVIFCIAWSRAEEIAPLLAEMANAYDLVCYKPQRDEVYLPTSLLTDKD